MIVAIVLGSLAFIFLLITIIITSIKKRDEIKSKFASHYWKRILKYLIICCIGVLVMTLIITITLNVAFDYSAYCYLWGGLADIIIFNVAVMVANMCYVQKVNNQNGKNRPE